MSNQRWLAFPEGFLWGAATASYQIEGGARDDGRGLSIWDTFSHTPGNTTNGDTGDVAADHYHRWQEDIDHMVRLGLDAYRFSIAWPRILPEGTGRVNQAGLDWYSRLVDKLLEKGIEPFVTLYHWDLPQTLQDRFGGWPDRQIVDAFVNYADVTSRCLGDRVHHWFTHNEPWVAAFVGYAFERHAPGGNSIPNAMKAVHNLLLSHGKTVPVLRANGDDKTEVGIVLNLNSTVPATDSPEDAAAAIRHDGFLNRMFLDPIFKGHYPEDIAELFAPIMPEILPGDMETIAAPIDAIGTNTYFRTVIAYDPSDEFGPMHSRFAPPPGEYTEMNWEVYPQGLYDLLVRLARDYNPRTIYVTENGAAFKDEVSPDGKVHDPRRLAYLQGHFANAHRAIQDGVPLKGYFVWSLMDNFEWGHGYTKRFGVIYIDYATQQRILKDSAEWYSQVTRKNGLEEPANS